MRRATGFSGETAPIDSRDAKSIVSIPLTATSFPWSNSLKFAAVRPRTGLPLESTTVTGTSTRLTVMVSFKFWAFAANASTATATTAIRMRNICSSERAEERSVRRSPSVAGQNFGTFGLVLVILRFAQRLRRNVGRDSSRPRGLKSAPH